MLFHRCPCCQWSNIKQPTVFLCLYIGLDVGVLLLLIVVLAVEQAVPAVTGPGERAQTHGALDTGLVPGALVHAQ